MAEYEVVVFCDRCGETHSLGGIVVTLDDGPADPTAIGDHYKGRELPPEIAEMLSLKIRCEGNSENFSLRDMQKQAFLVALKRTRVAGRTFRNETVIIDHRDFENCVFHECRIIMCGGDFSMNGCDFHDSRFLIGGAAGRAFFILEALRRGAAPIFESFLEGIRTGKTPVFRAERPPSR